VTDPVLANTPSLDTVVTKVPGAPKANTGVDDATDGTKSTDTFGACLSAANVRALSQVLAFNVSASG